jgi:hypothetical protein
MEELPVCSSQGFLCDLGRDSQSAEIFFLVRRRHPWPDRGSVVAVVTKASVELDSASRGSLLWAGGMVEHLAASVGGGQEVVVEVLPPGAG